MQLNFSLKPNDRTIYDSDDDEEEEEELEDVEMSEEPTRSPPSSLSSTIQQKPSTPLTATQRKSITRVSLSDLEKEMNSRNSSPVPPRSNSNNNNNGPQDSLNTSKTRVRASPITKTTKSTESPSSSTSGGSSSKNNSSNTTTSTTTSTIISYIKDDSLLDKFLRIATTDPNVIDEFKKDYKSRHWTAIRDKYSVKNAVRKGRWSDLEHKLIKKYVGLIADHDVMPLCPMNGPHATPKRTSDGKTIHRTQYRLLRHAIAVMIGRGIEPFIHEWNKFATHQKESLYDTFISTLTNLQDMTENNICQNVLHPSKKNYKMLSDEQTLNSSMNIVKTLLTQYQDRHREVNVYLRGMSDEDGPDPNFDEVKAQPFSHIAAQAAETLKQVQAFERSYHADLHVLLWKSTFEDVQ